jgi:hypothetical protein
MKTAPRDGSLFLAFNAPHGEYCVVGWDFLRRSWTDVGGGNQAFSVSFNRLYFTHWQLLPEKPEETT